MDLRELYQDIILEHGKSPRNFGKCEKHTHQAKGYNPLCGDKVHIYLKLNDEKKVENLTFEGSGCAISIASTSIMTELVKGKNLDVTKKIIEAFMNMIKSTDGIKSYELSDEQKIKIMSLSGVQQYPMRVKCATLAWHTLISAIDEKESVATTEINESWVK